MFALAKILDVFAWMLGALAMSMDIVKDVQVPPFTYTVSRIRPNSRFDTVRVT
jgi:hypothetical protein